MTCLGRRVPRTHLPGEGSVPVIGSGDGVATGAAPATCREREEYERDGKSHRTNAGPWLQY